MLNISKTINTKNTTQIIETYDIEDGFEFIICILEMWC